MCIITGKIFLLSHKTDNEGAAALHNYDEKQFSHITSLNVNVYDISREEISFTKPMWLFAVLYLPDVGRTGVLVAQSRARLPSSFN